MINRSSQENLAAFFLPASALRAILSKAKRQPLPCAVHEGQRLKQMTKEWFQKAATHGGEATFSPMMLRTPRRDNEQNLKPNSELCFSAW
jgi:hypothetical protein